MAHAEGNLRWQAIHPTILGVSSLPTQPVPTGQDPGKTAVPGEVKPPEINLGQASQGTEQAAKPPTSVDGNAPRRAQAPWLLGNGPVIVWFALFIVISGLLVLAVQLAGKKLIPLLAQPGNANRATPNGGTSQQIEAEELLQRASANDAAAPDQILAKSEGWIGKTQRTPRANGLIVAVLSSHDMHAREAAIQAELAMDGVSWNENGFDTLQRAVQNPGQRVWALWTLGALGNRGVEPARAVSIIESYLSDPDANIRASAVNGLAVLGGDETVPVLLDRFRNDASSLVQEQAACALAGAGMYTHEQQMVAAASLVNWLDDSRMTTPQRTWALHALRDISGENLGTESAAWRQWYENSH